MRPALVVSVLMMLITLCAASAMQDAQTKTPPATPPVQKQATSDGEKLFETNCLRCHKPPENLSPRESKTLLRHMRVRANLSEKDEQAILQYISPR
jgi:cytochrome c5